MPYDKKNPPDRIKGLPKHAQEIWISAYNAALKQYEGDEEKANATAWSAVKKSGYKKNEAGKWVKMSEVTAFGEVLFEEIDWDAPIEIFRAGKYPQGDISVTDLETIVANFNPDYHNPPLVKDHQESGPAFGWIKELWKEGKSLWARLRDIPGTVRTEIKQRAWSKISAAFYPDFEGKGLALRHVSLLGACPPQVKGMRTWKDKHGAFMPFMEFKITEEEQEAQKARSEKYGISIVESGNVTKPQAYLNVPDDQWADPVNYRLPCPNARSTQVSLEFWGEPEGGGLYSAKDQETIAKRLKGFAEKFKVDAKILKDSEGTMELTEAKVQELLKKNSDDLTTKFSDQLKTFKDESEKQIKELKEENKKLKEDQTTNFSEAEKKERKERVDKLVNELIKDGKITPAFKDAGFDQFLLALPADKVIEMGEGDDAKKIPVVDWAIDFFKNKIRGAKVHFGEVGKYAAETGDPKVLQFRVLDNKDSNVVSADSVELSTKAEAYAKENKVSFKEAVIAVSME